MIVRDMMAQSRAQLSKKADDEGKKSFAVAGTGELMTELIFDRLSQLSHTPEIILDETKLSLYNDSLVSLENILD